MLRDTGEEVAFHRLIVFLNLVTDTTAARAVGGRMLTLALKHEMPHNLFAAGLWGWVHGGFGYS